MKHYHSEILLAAPASAVFKAISTREGLRSWWTTTCEIGTEVGARSTFRFGEIYKVMRIDVLRPDKEVRWQCIEGTLEEWIGTTIVFRLEAQSPSSTLLRFEHIGLVPEVECFNMCSSGWNQYLGSLKHYAETGTGMPYGQ